MEINWQDIKTAPKNGTYILLLGDSGYTTTPHRIMVGCWIEGYRDGWVNHANDRITDSGSPPTHWAPLPPAPGIVGASNKVNRPDARSVEMSHNWQADNGDKTCCCCGEDLRH